MDVSGANVKLAFTHIVAVCDDPLIQTLLPHILIVRTDMISAANATLLAAELASNVIIVRMQRAWTSEVVIREWFIRLRIALRRHRESVQFIVYSDAFKAHITSAIWEHVADNHWHYCLIPARLTWALQPCDAYVMAPYKRNLALSWHRSFLRTCIPSSAITQCIRCVNFVCKEFINKTHWKTAFEHIGLVGHQNLLSWNTLHKLEYVDIPLVTNDLPSLAQLQSVFPAGHDIPIDSLFATAVANYE